MPFKALHSRTAKLQNVIIALLLFGCSFYLRSLAFHQTNYANGWDGYFYINEVKSLLEEGRMDVPDSSLVYPLLIFVQLLTNDYVLSLKIFSCLLAASFVVSMFFLACKWSGNKASATVIASFYLFSPHLTYFAAQYPKTLLGAILFLWLLYSLDAKTKWLPVLLLFANFFGHRITAVLSFLSLFFFYVFSALKQFAWRTIIIFLLILLIAGFLLPGVLNLLDAERFRGIFTMHPQFAPFSFVKTFGYALLSPWWITEIVIASIAFGTGIFLIISRKTTDARLLTLLCIFALLIFPFFQWSLDGPAFRLLLTFILICPITLIFYLDRLRNIYVAGVLSLSCLSIAFFSWKSYNPARHDPPYAIYDLMATKVNARLNTSSCELIIAHKSLAEYVVYTTGIDAMSWLPEYTIDKTKLWRIAADGKDVQFHFYLDTTDLDFIYRLTPSYVLVREDIWQKFLTKIKEDGNNELLAELNTWRNPGNMRPGYMLKDKRLDIRH